MGTTMKFFSLPLLILASGLFVACGGQSLDGGSNASALEPLYACDNRSLESTCAEFPKGTTRSKAESTCDGFVVDGRCPLEHAVGVCTVSTNLGLMTNTYYANGVKAHTEADARKTCEGFAGVFRTH